MGRPKRISPTSRGFGGSRDSAAKMTGDFDDALDELAISRRGFVRPDKQRVFHPGADVATAKQCEQIEFNRVESERARLPDAPFRQVADHQLKGVDRRRRAALLT